MTPEDTALFRDKLTELQSQLEDLEAAFAETGKPVELDQSRTGRLTRMDAMQAQQMALEGARRRKAQLLRIAGAIKRLDRGEYGNCFSCGEPIDHRRLAVDPTLTRCLVCVDA